MSCLRDQTDGSLSQFDLACVSAYACVCLVRVYVCVCLSEGCLERRVDMWYCACVFFLCDLCSVTLSCLWVVFLP